MFLYACTTNSGKLREFLSAASPPGLAHLTIEPLPGIRDIPPPEETGETFEENSALKAVYYSRFTERPVFADDSGLEINSLDGKPGVRSARYAGEHATDAANNELVLSQMNGVADRRARFVSVISLARRGELLRSTRGLVEGEILTRYRGSNGFGYDPLFFCARIGKTLAEATEHEKFQVSHRGNAMRALFDWINGHNEQLTGD